ncbi:MAG: HAD-IA family hydrolase [Dehalococcoidia bacterium]
MRRFDLIALDLGNVLSMVDEQPATLQLAEMCGRAEAEVFEAVFSPERKAVFEAGAESWEDHALRAIDSLKLQMTLEQFRSVYESVLTPNQAIFPLIDRLAASYRLALCSNTAAPHWNLERGRLPFGNRFDPAIVSYLVGAMKPDRRIYETLAREACVAPGRILFIDDRQDNVDGARLAGITAVRYTGLAQLEDDLSELGVLPC